MKIIHNSRSSHNLARLASLARFLGIEPEDAPVTNFQSLARAVDSAMSAPVACAAFDLESLAGICTTGEAQQIAALLRDSHAAVLLLSTAPDPAHQLTQFLTGGAVQGTDYHGRPNTVSFPPTPDRLSSELSGQTFPRKSADALTLKLCPGGDVDVLMSLERRPSFVRARVGRTNAFVWSTPRIFDIHRPLSAEKEFEEVPDEYIPAVIFLRHAYADRCWHNPDPGAGMVIDDPLLRKRYGFINFARLLQSARSGHFCVTLAFIPWNHWRSRPKQTKLFQDHHDCFGICAHGCDHTKGEFRSDDYQDLLGRNFVARQRMDRHRQRTGLEFEPLMVCPQEQYSLEAMRAFADSRQFLALVCTACMPRDLERPSVTGADILLPAQDSFFGFPVFKRHYWKEISVFAMSLFLGKPAILVEHHDFFRRGTAGVEAFASGLIKLRSQVRWTSLVEMAMRTHFRRRVGEGVHQIRFFTDAFKLEHNSPAAAEYHLVRRLPQTTLVHSINVDGEAVPFDRKNDWLTFNVLAKGPGTLQVQVTVPPVKSAATRAAGVRYHAAVALRRGLSEIRDNVIARSDLALRVGRSVMSALQQNSS